MHEIPAAAGFKESLSLHCLRFSVESFMIDEHPRSSSSGPTFVALVVGNQTILEIGGISDIGLGQRL